MNHVLIIGGGITGLAAAYRLQIIAPDVQITLVERDGRLGGKILTEHTDGFLIEGGPDSMLARKPRGVGLCEELGSAEQLHGRDPAHNKTFVRRHGALYPLPSGLTGMIPTNLTALEQNPLISSAGKERLAREAEIPPAAETGDESVGSFVTRRLGREVYEALIEPLMSGIYAGDGEQLSLAATFPQLRQLELKYGSLLKGLQASQTSSATPAAYPPFVALRGGLGDLVTSLVAQINGVQLLTGVGVETLQRDADGRTYLATLSDAQTISADAVIMTTPAFISAKLLADIAPDLAAAHAAIPHASSATVCLAFNQGELATHLDGYGYVIPRVEETDILACTWTSSKWQGRAPTGQVLLRVYLGRYGRRDILEETDAALVALARSELREMLDISAPPTLARVYRWPNGMPQYTIGHLDRLAQIEAGIKQQPGLFVAGAAYRGVGIPDCIHSAEQAAQAAAIYLAQPVYA